LPIFADMVNVTKVLETPNPKARRFRLDLPVAGRSPVSVRDAAHAEGIPAAKALFSTGFVSSLFLLENSAVVTLVPEGDWEELLPEITMTLEEHLTPWSGAREAAEAADEPAPPEDFFALPFPEQLRLIERTLDLKVRPGLAADGGGAEMTGLEGKTVYIHYTGACGNCPSAGSTTLDFLRDALHAGVSPELEVELS